MRDWVPPSSHSHWLRRGLDAQHTVCTPYGRVKKSVFTKKNVFFLTQAPTHTATHMVAGLFLLVAFWGGRAPAPPHKIFGCMPLLFCCCACPQYPKPLSGLDIPTYAAVAIWCHRPRACAPVGAARVQRAGGRHTGPPAGTVSVCSVSVCSARCAHSSRAGAIAVRVIGDCIYKHISAIQRYSYNKHLTTGHTCVRHA